jgi:hypothetical protein
LVSHMSLILHPRAPRFSFSIDYRSFAALQQGKLCDARNTILRSTRARAFTQTCILRPERSDASS